MASTTDTSRDETELKIPLPVTVVAVSLFLWAAAHAVWTRTVGDFVRYPLYFAAPATVVLYGAILREWWKSTPRKVDAEYLWMAVAVPIALYLAAAAYYAVGASLKDTYFWLQSLDLTREQKIAVAVAATLAAGIVLFYFRRELRSTYGLTEAVVGLVVAGSRVADYLDHPTSDQAFYLTVLTAGVYLVVRGLDNIDQGLKKDPIALRLMALLRGRSAAPPAPASAAASTGVPAVAPPPAPAAPEPAPAPPPGLAPTVAAPAQQTPA